MSRTPAAANGRPARPRLLLGAVAAAVSALPVAALALVVRSTSTSVVHFDQDVVRHATALTLRHDVLRRSAEVGAYVLHPWVFRLAVLAAAVALWRRHARAAAWWAASTMAVGTLLGAALKLVVSRARPQLDDPVTIASGYSFPSGHALNAALGVTLLAVLLWRPAARRSRRVALVVVAVLLAAATGADRILLGVHFPTDVAAGYLVAVLVVASSWVAFGPVLRERARREADRALTQGVATPSTDHPADHPSDHRGRS